MERQHMVGSWTLERLAECKKEKWKDKRIKEMKLKDN